MKLVNKGVMWLVLVLTLSLFVFGAYDSVRTCEVGTGCDITAFTINKSSTGQFINNTACNVTIFSNVDYSTYLVANQTMVKPVANFGLFNHTQTFTSTGHYPAFVYCLGTNVAILGSGHNDPVITLVGLTVVDSGSDLLVYDIEVVNTTTILNNTGFFGTLSSSSNWAGSIIIGLLIVVGTLAYYSVSLVLYNKWLRLFFFLLSFLVLIITVNTASELVTILSSTSTSVINLLDTTYSVLVWVLIFTLGVLIILFIAGVLDNASRRRGEITP